MAKFGIFLDKQRMSQRAGSGYIYRPCLRVKAGEHVPNDIIILSVPFSHNKSVAEEKLREAVKELRDVCDAFLGEETINY